MPRWPDPLSRSAALYSRALNVLPGGISRTLPWQTPFPVYAATGYGAYMTDADGTRRLDLLNNFASLLHGHAFPPMVEAVTAQVAKGTAFTNPTETEIALAEAITARAPSLEQVRFCNSGSEAVMSAMKAARALTGRPKIVKAEGVYHGLYDFAEVSLDSNPENWGNDPSSVPYAKGTPKGVTENVVVIPYNNTAAAERIIRANAAEIAGVILDPAPSYFGFVPLAPEFLAMVRRVTREIGALLILDEVITFRCSVGGAQDLLGIDPDLTTLAKIIGGGFPVGAVAGRKDVMGVYDHRQGKPLLPWSGTFTANPISMTAGKVTLDHYGEAQVQHLNRLGERLRTGVAKAFGKTSFPGQIIGFTSLFGIFGHRRPISDHRSAYSSRQELGHVEKLQEALVREGYLIATSGKGFLSTPMTDDDVDGFVLAVEEICRKGW